jgi:hypothetical protein
MRLLQEGSQMLKGITLAFLVCVGAASLANGQSVSKCFRAEWLQGERSINLTLTGSKVSGTFIVSGGDEPDKEYKFTGTRRGNTLTVAFADNKLPDVAPSELKGSVWMLVRRGKQELLRIKVYGKNYNTNKYEKSFAYFESCKSEQKQPTSTKAGASHPSGLQLTWGAQKKLH